VTLAGRGVVIDDRTMDEAPAAPPAQRAPRALWRTVAIPAEHGGWGLTLEPALLGLLVAWSTAGVCLALAAFIGFLARTPLKLVLVDASRHRTLPRTVAARRVAGAELLVLAGLTAAAFALARGPFWVPALVAGPLVAVELWFDMRSRSRRLVPELAGAIGISSVVAMIVLADGGSARLACGLWLVLAARSLTSIPFVRAQIARLHQHAGSASTLVYADLAAVVVAAAAVGLDHALGAGAVAIVAVVIYQRASSRSPLPRAVVLGIRQMVLGLVVVVLTAVGVWVT